MKTIIIGTAVLLITGQSFALNSRNSKHGHSSRQSHQHHQQSNHKPSRIPPNKYHIDNPFNEFTTVNLMNPKANGGAGVYAVAGPSYVDGQGALITYDITTGDATTILDGSETYLTGEELSCFDDINNIWYFVYEEVNSDESITVGLYPFNLNDPTTQLDPIILSMFASEVFVGAGQACVGDPNTGDIYVFGHSINNTHMQLLIRISRDSNTMNTTSSIVSEYNGLNDIPLLSGQCTLYDSKRDKMWIASSIGDNETDVAVDWFYIDAKTGTIEKNISDLIWPMYTCAYDQSLDVIVGIEFNSEESDGNFTYVLKTADPVTLDITSNFDPIQEWCSFGPVDTYDYKNGIQYQLLYKNPDGACVDDQLNLVGHLVGMDVNTGTVTTMPEICIFNASYITAPWDMQYWDGQ